MGLEEKIDFFESILLAKVDPNELHYLVDAEARRIFALAGPGGSFDFLTEKEKECWRRLVQEEILASCFVWDRMKRTFSDEMEKRLATG